MPLMLWRLGTSGNDTKLIITMKKNGFSLIELMVTVAVLSFGLVMIYQSFFMVMDVTSIMPRYVASQFLMDAVIWQKKDALWQNKYLPLGGEEGNVAMNGKSFEWCVDTEAVDSVQGLYKVDVDFMWRYNGKKYENSRVAYIRR